MWTTIEDELDFKITGIIRSAGEHYIPATEVDNTIEILKKWRHGVFRIEMFNISNEEIKPDLSKIHIVFVEDRDFDSFVQKSLREVQEYVEAEIGELTFSNEMYFNILHDNCFD